MEFTCILPTELFITIALVRPDAYNKLLRACKRLHGELSGHKQECVRKWIQRRNWTSRDQQGQEVKIYAGVCPNGVLHGEYKILNVATNKLTDVYNYQFGILHGPAYQIDHYDWRTSFNYQNGVLHGEYKLVGGGYKLDLLKMTFVDGKRHGVYISQYISGGTEWEIPYVNDKMHGDAVYWYVDGLHICCREQWRRGMLQGTRIFYDRKGNIVGTEEYVDGAKVEYNGNWHDIKNNPRFRMNIDFTMLGPIPRCK